MSSKRAMVAVLVVFTFLLVGNICADRYIYDENGDWNGLINVNPDVKGEPWVAGAQKPYTAEELKVFANMPEFEPSEQSKRATLPKSAVHFGEPAFAPIFNQVGGSCAQASGMGYTYTYELNNLRKTVASLPENNAAYGFTYDFINGGGTGGTWYYTGWDILKKMGCAFVKDFNGKQDGDGTSTYWARTFDAYKNANKGRVVTYQKISAINTAAGLTKMKQWFTDHGDGTGKNGGIMVFSANHSTTNKKITAGTVDVGKNIATSFGSSMDHAMTFAGFNDEVDGTGAVLLVNSWGTSFGNGNGTIWFAYSGLGTVYMTECYTINVSEFKPKIMVKAVVSSTARNTVVLSSGFAATEAATAPTKTKTFAGAFNKSGGANPMGGRGGPAAIEIGLDASDFSVDFVGGKGKIFITGSGTGTIASMSAIVFDASGVATEFKSSQANVALPASVGVWISGVGNLVALTQPQAREGIYIFKNNSNYMLGLPSQEAYQVKVTDIRGRVVESFTTSGNAQKIVFGDNLASGAHFVKAVAGNKSFTTKFDVTR